VRRNLFSSPLFGLKFPSPGQAFDKFKEYTLRVDLDSLVHGSKCAENWKSQGIGAVWKNQDQIIVKTN